ncbi:MAG: RNA polymerase sigma factor, partial [Acidimicrobiales bacterium]
MALAPTDVASIDETTAIRLVAAHRRGDREAFAEIVRSHYPSLLVTARHRLGNAEDAKDAVQETLLRALLALDRFGDTGDWRLGAWLNTILLHVCADIPARRKRTLPLTDWVIENHPDASEQSTSDHVALAAVQRAIGELPESQRRAFELRLVDGRPYDEVAGALGITEVNARARVRRARAALRHALESTSAVKGVFAAIPLVLGAPFRSALRRVVACAGHPARVAGSQALASSAATAGSSAASAIAGTPVETSLQMITSVSSTPLGQAVVASMASVPAKGSVVLGIVASLATAGGLSAPAALSGSTASPSAAPVRVVRAATAPASAPAAIATAASPSASSNASGTSATTGSTVASSAAAAKHSRAAPDWVTLAASAVAYRFRAPSGSSASSSPLAASSGSAVASSSGSSATGTAVPSATASSPATTSPQGAGATSAVTSSTTTSPVPASTTASPVPASTTASPVPASAAASILGSAVSLPVGTCTGVTGFPGVTAPTSVPPLTSSVLDAILSTGSLKLANVEGSPAFGGTALVKATSGSTAPVRVKVGTCLAEGGSILAVDMTGTTGDAVQLVGSLVAQPFAMTTGSDAYLFRGNVVQVAGTARPGGALPWALPQGFVAEVQVQQLAKTGSLTVVFLHAQDEGPGSSATPGVAGTTPSTRTASPTGAAAPTTRTPTGTSGSGVSTSSSATSTSSTPSATSTSSTPSATSTSSTPSATSTSSTP